jgi:hypothetical protein
MVPVGGFSRVVRDTVVDDTVGSTGTVPSLSGSC